VRFPLEVERLFWEVDPRTVDVVRHADYVIERVAQRGPWVAMLWLARTYPKSVLADFLKRKGHRLPPRDRVFWSLVAGLEAPADIGGARPPWAGS